MPAPRRVAALRRMLFALHLWRREALRGCEPAERESAIDYRRIALEDICNDRLASGICARSSAVNCGNDEAAEPVNLEPYIDRAIRGARSHDRPDGFRTGHAGRICSPP